MKIRLRPVLITFFIIISLIAVYSFIPGKKTGEAEENAAVNYNKLDEVMFEVKTSAVILGDLDKKISANGIVKAYKDLEITSNTGGYITRINVNEGKQVNKNDLLIELDNRELLIALKDAETSLEEAKIQYVIQKKETGEGSKNNPGVDVKAETEKLEARYRKSEIKQDELLRLKADLESKNILGGGEREKYIEIKSGLTAARNNYERAKLNLSYAKIYSPFAGIVSDMDLAEGKRINAGEKLFKLLETNRLKIDVGVLENEVSLIKTGSTAEIKLNAVPDKTFDGTILYVNPAIDPVTKTCRVTLELNNSKRIIKPGMFATVKLFSQKLTSRILVPKSALLVRDKRSLVFVQEGDLAKWRYVEAGEQNDKYIEIKSGVLPGEKVITEGHFTLAHDAKIKVTEDK